MKDGATVVKRSDTVCTPIKTANSVNQYPYQLNDILLVHSTPLLMQFIAVRGTVEYWTSQL